MSPAGAAAEPARFELPRALAGRLLAHALAGWPEEVCGILGGPAHEAEAARASMLYRGRNVSSTPQVAFELDAETLARQISLEEEALEMVGIYHSHPAGPPVPSATDVQMAAYPGVVHLICSLADRERPSLRAFLIEGGAVRELELVLT